MEYNLYYYDSNLDAVVMKDKDGNELSTKDMVKQNEMAVRTINVSFRDSASEFKIDLGAGSDDE